MEQDRPQVSYGALRLIATIFRALAWVQLIVGPLATIAATVAIVHEAEATGAIIPILVFVGGILWTLFQAVLLFAFADLIIVFLAIEQNTADTADNLEILLQREGGRGGVRSRRP